MRALSVLSLLALGGPAVAAPLSAGPLNIGMAIPGDADVQKVVLGAVEQISIADRTLMDGELASLGAIRIGSENVMVGNMYSATDIRLGIRNFVEGDMFAVGTITEQANTVGDVAFLGQSTFADPQLVQIDVTVPDTSAGNLNLFPDDTQILTDVRRGRLNVFSRATLTITAGTWFLDHLSVEPQGTLVLDDSAGPITLVIGESLTIRGDWIDGTDNGEVPDVLVAYDGAQTVSIEQPFSGSLLAPNARVILGGNQATHEGALFAKSFQVRPDVGVQQQPFRASPPPFTCPEGQILIEIALGGPEGPGDVIVVPADSDDPSAVPPPDFFLPIPPPPTGLIRFCVDPTDTF